MMNSYVPNDIKTFLHYLYLSLLFALAVFADVSTVVNLEMLRNIRSAHSQHTLFGILNSTKTRMGARLLRANILQPPCG